MMKAPEVAKAAPKIPNNGIKKKFNITLKSTNEII